MVIKRGSEWGADVTAPVDATVVTTDAELSAAMGVGTTPVIRGGDLYRSVGSPGGGVGRRLPIDLIAVTVDDRRLTAVAHVVARRSGRLGWWRGPIVAVCNVDHVGTWDVAPRAHPNDGWLDVVEVNEAMSVRTRWQARRRLPTGDHVPHPEIAVRRVRSESFAFARPLSVWVDGVAVGTGRTLGVEVVADGAEIYV